MSSTLKDQGIPFWKVNAIEAILLHVQRLKFASTQSSWSRRCPFRLQLPRRGLWLVWCLSSSSLRLILSRNLALSLAAGNATIWKPSPSTPLCSIAVTTIIARVLEQNGTHSVKSMNQASFTQTFRNSWCRRQSCHRRKRRGLGHRREP